MDALSQDIRAAAERAVLISRSRPGGTLNYTLSSFDVVEQILAEAYQYIDDLGASQIDGLVSSMKSYLLELARRNFGGPTVGFRKRAARLDRSEPTFHVAVATWDRCEAVFQGTPGTTFPFHMSGFVERARVAKPGDRVYLDAGFLASRFGGTWGARAAIASAMFLALCESSLVLFAMTPSHLEAFPVFGPSAISLFTAVGCWLPFQRRKLVSA